MYKKSNRTFIDRKDGKRKHWPRKAMKIDGFVFPLGNTKTGPEVYLVLDPFLSCDRSAPCFKSEKCYFISEGKVFTSVQAMAAHNSKLYLEKGRKAYLEAVEKAFRYAMDHGLGFRFYEGGDIPDYMTFDGLMRIFSIDPGRAHGMTKKYSIVNQWIADHGGNREAVLDICYLYFSEWEGFPMDNRYGMPLFRYTVNPDRCTCPEQAAKMIGREWSCNDCFNHRAGCYNYRMNDIWCLDHHAEQKRIKDNGKKAWWKE